VVFFALKDGDLPHDISNQKVEIIVKDAQGKIKIISTINNLISSVGGLFSMVIPSELYQSAGDIEEGYIRVSNTENVVVSSIPITFKVVANNIIMTSNASKEFIDSVQMTIDDANTRIDGLTNNIGAQEQAVLALKTSLNVMIDMINNQQMPTLSGSNTFSEENTFLKPLAATLKPVILTDGTDFNSLTTPGHYQASGTFPNSPYPKAANAYDIDVEKLSNGFIVQKISQFGTNYINTFMRAKVNVNWQDYERIQFYKNKFDVITKVVVVNGVNIVITRTGNSVMFTIQNYAANTKYAGQFSQWGDSGVIPSGFRPISLTTVNAEHAPGLKQDGSSSAAQDGLIAVGTDGGIYTRMFDMPLPNGSVVPFIQSSGMWITRDDFPIGS